MTLLEPGSLLMIFIAAAFTSNILLAKFLGMCSFVAISRSMRTAFCMGVAVVFVTVCTAVLNYLVYHGLLTPGGAVFGDTDLTHLKLLLFILVVAGFVQLVEMVLERYLPSLYFSLGIFLPLITVNCAILGVNLFMVDPKYEFTLVKSAVYALGSSPARPRTDPHHHRLHGPRVHGPRWHRRSLARKTMTAQLGSRAVFSRFSFKEEKCGDEWKG